MVLKMRRVMTSVWVLAFLLLGKPVYGQAECYVADADTGTLSFEAITDGRAIQGQFERFDVALCLDGNEIMTSTIQVTVDTASANTKSRDRDQTLKGESFFWVSAFPKAHWSSGEWRALEGRWQAICEGALTLRDVTQSQSVMMSLDIRGDETWLVGEADIARLDYNVGLGEFEDTEFIANEVKLQFELKLLPIQ